MSNVDQTRVQPLLDYASMNEVAQSKRKGGGDMPRADCSWKTLAKVVPLDILLESDLHSCKEEDG